MCQMRSPPAGSELSYPAFWRFSTRKYSLPPVPSFQSRCTARLLLTSGNDSVPPVVTLVADAQPWLALHHAEGCTGMSPPPPHDPPAIRHQLPMPSEEPSVS